MSLFGNEGNELSGGRVAGGYMAFVITILELWGET
jgi:hypothetical protein